MPPLGVFYKADKVCSVAETLIIQCFQSKAITPYSHSIVPGGFDVMS